MIVDVCEVCNGTGKNYFNESCTFCNGTGEWNAAAAEYIKNHICKCIHWDREFCPICKKKCHHSSAQNQNQIIDSGFSGLGASKSKPKTRRRGNDCGMSWDDK